MSRFRDALNIVPRNARILAGFTYFGAAVAIGLTNWQKTHDAYDPMPRWAFAVLVGLAPLVAVAWTLLIGYIYGDASCRGMRPTAWALLAFFTPGAIGIILYFLLRTAVQRSCVSCGAANQPNLFYCPKCGCAVQRTCPQCNRSIMEDWKYCAHCGVNL